MKTGSKTERLQCWTGSSTYYHLPWIWGSLICWFCRYR